MTTPQPNSIQQTSNNPLGGLQPTATESAPEAPKGLTAAPVSGASMDLGALQAETPNNTGAVEASDIGATSEDAPPIETKKQNLEEEGPPAPASEDNSAAAGMAGAGVALVACGIAAVFMGFPAIGISVAATGLVALGVAAVATSESSKEQAPPQGSERRQELKAEQPKPEEKPSPNSVATLESAPPPQPIATAEPARAREPVMTSQPTPPVAASVPVEGNV